MRLEKKKKFCVYTYNFFFFLQINGLSGHTGNQSCGDATEQESNLETVSVIQ